MRPFNKYCVLLILLIFVIFAVPTDSLAGEILSDSPAEVKPAGEKEQRGGEIKDDPSFGKSWHVIDRGDVISGLYYRIPNPETLKTGTVEVFIKRGETKNPFVWDPIITFLGSKQGERELFSVYVNWQNGNLNNFSTFSIDQPHDSTKDKIFYGNLFYVERTIPPGEWVHLAFSWGPEPAKDNKVYVNGKEVTVHSSLQDQAPVTPADDFSRVVIQTDQVVIGFGEMGPMLGAEFGKIRVHDQILTSFDLSVFGSDITSITDNTFYVPGISGKLTTGDTVQVQLEADPGGTASFDMGVVTGIPMTETDNPGTYGGEYTIKAGDDFEDGQIVSHFTNASGVEASPALSPNRWTIETHTNLNLEVEKNDLPADENSRTRIKVTVTDVNGNPGEGHQIRIDLATVEQYTGIVGAGDFGENVGADVEATWKSVTDSWGEVEFDYRSGFAAKTVIVTAKDLTANSVGVDYITSYIEGLIDIALTRPVSKAAARRGLLYYMDVEASRNELTADGRSRSVIRAYVRDPNGEPVEGDEIVFSIDQENGTIRTIRAVTDKSGKATAEYRAGKKIGIVQITATDITRGLSGHVSITLLSDAPAKVYLEAKPDSMPADGLSRSDVMVKVTDINDNPNEDTEVLFSIEKGSGELRDERLVTDRFGEAENVFTAGKEPGVATIKATVRSSVPTDEELALAKNVIFAGYSDLGSEMEITKWIVRNGDEVQENGALCEYRIRGEQFTFTLFAPYDLRVDEIMVETWDDVEVGQTLAIVTPVTLR